MPDAAIEALRAVGRVHQQGIDDVVANFVKNCPRSRPLGRHQSCMKNQRRKWDHHAKRMDTEELTAVCSRTPLLRKRASVSGTAIATACPVRVGGSVSGRVASSHACCIHNIKRPEQRYERDMQLKKIVETGSARGFAQDLRALAWAGDDALQTAAHTSIAALGLEFRTPPVMVTNAAVQNSVTHSDVSTILALEAQYHPGCRKRMARLAAGIIQPDPPPSPEDTLYITPEHSVAHAAVAAAHNLLAKGHPAVRLSQLLPEVDQPQLRAVANILTEKGLSVVQEGSLMLIVPARRPWATALEGWEADQSALERYRRGDTGPQTTSATCVYMRRHVIKHTSSPDKCGPALGTLSIEAMVQDAGGWQLPIMILGIMTGHQYDVPDKCGIADYEAPRGPHLLKALAIAQDIVSTLPGRCPILHRYTAKFLKTHATPRSVLQLMCDLGHCPSPEAARMIHLAGVPQTDAQIGDLLVARATREDGTLGWACSAADNLDWTLAAGNGSPVNIGTIVHFTHSGGGQCLRTLTTSEHPVTSNSIGPKNAAAAVAACDVAVRDSGPGWLPKNTHPPRAGNRGPSLPTNRAKLEQLSRRRFLLMALNGSAGRMPKASYNEVQPAPPVLSASRAGAVVDWCISQNINTIDAQVQLLYRVERRRLQVGQDFIQLIVDGGLYQSLVRLLWANAALSQTIVALLGMFHLDMTILKTMGDFLDGSGVFDGLIFSEFVSGENALKTVRHCKNYNRTVDAMQAIYQVSGPLRLTTALENALRPGN